MAELKWCGSRAELGWTLSDVYKLVALKEQDTAEACYAVVAAPNSYWDDLTLDCARLFSWWPTAATRPMQLSARGHAELRIDAIEVS